MPKSDSLILQPDAQMGLEELHIWSDTRSVSGVKAALACADVCCNHEFGLRRLTEWGLKSFRCVRRDTKVRI